jgi:integrase/recombinase XerD
MKMQGLYRPYIEQYLDFKRSLGYKLRDAEYIFILFDRLTITRNETEIGITKELSDKWCEARPNESHGTRVLRVSMLSLFARFLCNIGYPSYVPELLTRRRFFVPYIFSKDEVTTLLSACDQYSLDNVTSDPTNMLMSALFRLLYGTGLRIGEALALKEPDINLGEQYLIVRESKNGTERMVPMSGSLTAVCRQYQACKRSDLSGNRSTDLFFVKNDNTSYRRSAIYQTFRQVLREAGIPHRGKSLGPRLHDLRHTFACHSLAAMAESGIDMYHSLPILSTYLGHRTLESTDKYVRLTSEMFPKVLKDVSAVCGYVFPEPRLTDEEL